MYFKQYSLVVYLILSNAMFRNLLQAIALSYHVRTTSHAVGYKNFDSQINFTDLSFQMDKLIIIKNLRYGNACVYTSDAM